MTDVNVGDRVRITSNHYRGGECYGATGEVVSVSGPSHWPYRVDIGEHQPEPLAWNEFEVLPPIEDEEWGDPVVPTHASKADAVAKLSKTLDSLIEDRRTEVADYQSRLETLFERYNELQRELDSERAVRRAFEDAAKNQADEATKFEQQVNAYSKALDDAYAAIRGLVS